MVTFQALGRFGRAGNQLFQIASTIGIAKKNGTIANFPPWYCNYTHKDMSCFFAGPLDQSYDGRPVQTNHELNFAYYDVVLNGDTNLHGYWQSEKYFKHCKDEIRAIFAPSKHVSDIIDRYDMSEFCSIHVRRGDYIGNNFHEVCDADYYDRAIKLARKKTDKFVVFSDDIEWCKGHFPTDFKFAEGNIDAVDLHLMAGCGHNIICNSSFSWWAAWLNNNPDKLVVAPHRWFGAGSGIEDKDVYTKEMTKI